MAWPIWVPSELLVFLLGAASSRSACAAVLRPATFCLLVCFAVLLFEQPYCGLLAISSPDSSHAVAWIMFVLVRLLAFSPGAASSRFARAAVLRPAPFCLLVSFALISSRRLFLQWVWAAFLGLLALMCVFPHRGLDHASAWSVWCFRRLGLAQRFLALPSVAGVFRQFFLCVYCFSAMGVSGPFEVCSPFGPLFSPT